MMEIMVTLYVKYIKLYISSSPKEAACSRQFPSPVVARGSSFLQLVHMVDHQFRRPAHTYIIISEKQKEAKILIQCIISSVKLKQTEEGVR